MVIWFAVMAFVIVAAVFDSPALDYRYVMLGGVLPVAEGLVGGPWVLHTLAGSVLIMVVVMASTVGRRLVRRRWLGVPIGTFLHLVLDGTWADTTLFWWPFGGGDLGSGSIPEFRNLGLAVVLEALGLVAGVWAWRRYGFDEGERRRRFIRSGRLDRDLR